MDILRTTKKGTGLRYFISIIIVIFVHPDVQMSSEALHAGS